MPKQTSSTPRAASAACLIALFAFLLAAITLPDAAARAADCIAAPNGQPPDGQHWWYRSDRVSGRKCWYLGPKDAARAAALQARAQAEPAESARAAPRATTPAPPAPESGPPSAHGARGIPFLVDWSELLQAASMVGHEQPALNALATRERAVDTPVTTGVQPNDEMLPESAALRSDAADSARATLIRMLLIVAAAMLIAGGLCQTVYGLARAWHRRAAPRRAGWRAPGPHEPAPARFAPLPQELPARFSAPVGRYHRVTPFDLDDLPRILHALPRQTA